MSEQRSDTILIIGGPNAGKTHFGGQLYGRLQTRNGFYKITSPPENLIVFKEVLESLNDGKSAGHTNVAANDLLELEIEDSEGRKSVFSFPDYGGEQIRSIVNDRRINKTWKEQIEKSNSWMLFIRPDEILPLEDIINRGIPDLDTIEKRNTNAEPMIMSVNGFFIELLQMLLFSKRVATQQKIKSPKLTVVLSCYDCIENEVVGKLPVDILKEKLPALYNYIEATWHDVAFNVIGLSATGKTLSDKEVDMEYVKKGPEHFGYIITPEGEREEDLTLSISTFIGEGK
jgi:hypothetical protein